MNNKKPGRPPGAKNKNKPTERPELAAAPINSTTGNRLVDLKVISYASGSGALSFTWQGRDEGTGDLIAFRSPSAAEIISSGTIRAGWKLLSIDGQLVAVGPVTRVNDHILEVADVPTRNPGETKVGRFAYDPMIRPSPFTEFQVLGPQGGCLLGNISLLSRLRFFLQHEHEITTQLKAYAQ